MSKIRFTILEDIEIDEEIATTILAAAEPQNALHNHLVEHHNCFRQRGYITETNAKDLREALGKELARRKIDERKQLPAPQEKVIEV